MKRLLWPLKVNTALAGFGVRPTSLNSDLRTDVQLFGVDAGLTPEETALVLLALAFGIRIGMAGLASDDEFDLMLATLGSDRKVDFRKPEVIDALEVMGYATDGVPCWDEEAIMLHRGVLRGEPENAYAKTPIAQLFAHKRWSMINVAVKREEAN